MRLPLNRLGRPADACQRLQLAALSLLLACTDATTSPEHGAVVPAVSTAALATTTPAIAAIEDALDRAVPALSDDAAATGLRVAVEAVLEALSRKDAAAAIDAIERADRLASAYAQSINAGNGDAADLDVIALALASVRP